MIYIYIYIYSPTVSVLRFLCFRVAADPHVSTSLKLGMTGWWMGGCQSSGGLRTIFQKCKNQSYNAKR